MSRLFKFATAAVLVFAMIFVVVVSRTDTQPPAIKLESRTAVTGTEAFTQSPPLKVQPVPASRIALTIDTERQA